MKKSINKHILQPANAAEGKSADKKPVEKRGNDKSEKLGPVSDQDAIRRSKKQKSS